MIFVTSKAKRESMALPFFFCFFIVAIHAKNSHEFSTEMPPITGMKEKTSHLHFYWHDTLNGQNPTAIQVAAAPSTNSSATKFGFVRMMDDPLTERPEATSKLVGRAQGLYASAGLQEMGLLMVMNLAFVEGKYNGSTIVILGRNAVFNPVRELPVVGGSGLFRLARGYAKVKTLWFDTKSGNAVVEYNVVVIHY